VSGWTLRISAITPMLDEERGIEAHLRRLARLPGLHEVIVVDGGSSDRSREIAASVGGVTMLRTRAGRALQMNAGAAAATGDVLLFVHADVTLPASAAEHVERALADQGVVAGGFLTWTVPAAGGVPLGPLLHLADLRSRYSGVPYGDQALFVRRAVFDRLGGFDDLPLMEDVDLSRRLRREGRIARVSERVIVSGRRFQARPVTYTLMVNIYPLRFRLGVPAGVLARFYGKVR
jgi:rSAM/selenodomain-associated transferase 2